MPHQPDQPDTEQPTPDPAKHARLIAQFTALWERFTREQLEKAVHKMAGPVVKVKHSACGAGDVDGQEKEYIHFDAAPRFHRRGAAA
jgi:hypothetical protein